MRKEAKKVLDDLRIDISPDQIVGDLPVSKQQMVEIAKALSINARILIMDEPTSSLTAKEIDDLFRIIRKLRDEGRGSYIFHTDWKNCLISWTELPSCEMDNT